MKTIAVLFGGRSPEHAVSLQSAGAVLNNLDKSRYTALPVGITREGKWYLYGGDLAHIPDGSWETDTGLLQRLAVVPGGGLVCADSLEPVGCTAALPILHGRYGEDGTVQGLLELAGVPYIGCGVLSSAVCMDKDRAHRLAAAAGITVPESVVLGREDTDKLDGLTRPLGWPLFVKPLRGGSSIGMSRVTDIAELKRAVETALLYDDRVIIEKEVPGFEVGCAVIGREKLFVGRVDRIELRSGFFDYEEKYSLKSSRILMPADISEACEERIKETAQVLFRALDCRDFARVDMFLTPEGDIVFNEVNTIPGFTEHSRFPHMMRGAGLDFSTLLSRIVEGTE